MCREHLNEALFASMLEKNEEICVELLKAGAILRVSERSGYEEIVNNCNIRTIRIFHLTMPRDYGWKKMS